MMSLRCVAFKLALVCNADLDGKTACKCNHVQMLRADLKLFLHETINDNTIIAEFKIN